MAPSNDNTNYYIANQIDETCWKDITNLDVTDGTDAEFTKNCSGKSFQSISSTDIENYANELIEKYTEYKANNDEYKLKVKLNTLDDHIHNRIMLKQTKLKDELNTITSTIRDKLYTQSCYMWNTNPIASSLLCNINLINTQALNINQQKLASLEMIDNNTKIYNETLIKIYLTLIVNGSMFYLIYKTLKQ
jgi:hypothetical protein